MNTKNVTHLALAIKVHADLCSLNAQLLATEHSLLNNGVIFPENYVLKYLLFNYNIL